MDIFQKFLEWWNRLAHKNGKLKFRTQREAAEFVRRVQNEGGGPNNKLIEMRKVYVEANRIRAEREQTRPVQHSGTTSLSR